MKKKILAGLAVGVMMLGISRTASATLFTEEATLQNSFPAAINATETVWGNVDFGHGFDSIESITVKMFFGTDKLTMPNDVIIIGFPFQFGFMGTAYSSGIQLGPFDEYSFDENWQGSINALMDGSTNFYLAMQRGSVDVREIQFQINGTTSSPVPEPATMLLMGTGLAGLLGARRKKLPLLGDLV